MTQALVERAAQRGFVEIAAQHLLDVEINATSGRAVGIPADVSESSQVKNAVGQAVGAFGRLDILVPNAGIQMHMEDGNAVVDGGMTVV